MARVGLHANVGQSLGDGHYVIHSANNDGGAALDAAVAVLVADAAAPTQAHVTTANTALTAFKAPHVVLTYDTTAVTSMNQLKRAVAALLTRAEGSGLR